MRTALLSLALLFVGSAFLTIPGQAQAQLSTAQRKTLTEIRTDLNRAGSYLRRKNTDEATKIVTAVEEKLATLVKESPLDEQDRTVIYIRKTLELRKSALERLGVKLPENGNPVAAAGGVSFTKEIAPILTTRCMSCHGNNGSGGLSLNTFAGMVKGGKSGALLQAGNSRQSMLLDRLTTTGQRRMPRNANALPNGDIQKIAKWIDEGAKFDGNSQTVTLDKLAVMGEDPKVAANTPNNAGPVTILKPTGSETVSFKKDIAPFMVNICLRCHGEQNPRSGFSLHTFEKLMQGGSSGRVVVPGDIDGSRLWDLVGKQKPVKMPPGQLLITRSNWRNLQTWIKEGARFDGDDAKAPLRELVPTEEELKAMELAKLSPTEFAQRRMRNAETNWKRVMGREEFRKVESKEFFVYGNVSESRLQQVSNWAESQISSIAKTFGDKNKDKTIWPGKLTVFVVKTRFGFEEFNLTLKNRQTPKNMFGDVSVKPPFEEAFLVVQDVGDVVKADNPGLELVLMDKLTEAYFAKGDSSKLPNWMTEGAGLALAWEKNRDSEFLADQEALAWENLSTMDASKPEAVFANGTFSPSGTKAVGFTLSKFLLGKGGAGNYKKLVDAIQGGQTMEAAMKNVYRIDLKTMARVYAGSLKKRPR